jgi:hypothetical protein
MKVSGSKTKLREPSLQGPRRFQITLPFSRSMSRPIARGGRVTRCPRRADMVREDRKQERARDGAAEVRGGNEAETQRKGSESTHCRAGMLGVTFAARCAATSAMRRPQQAGQ